MSWGVDSEAKLGFAKKDRRLRKVFLHSRKDERIRLLEHVSLDRERQCHFPQRSPKFVV